MRLVALADIHQDTRLLPEIAADLEAADLIILSGDLTGFGRRAQADDVLEAARRYNGCILAVAGNCDHPEIDAHLSRQGINLHARHMVFDEVALLGLGGSLPCPERTLWEFSEQELAALLKQAAAGAPDDRPVVLVSHQPPYQTATDIAHGNRHVGSRSVRGFIERCQPDLVITGHIHESRGIDRLGRTTIVNPGPLRRGGYAWVEIDNRGLRTEIRTAQR